MSQLFGTDGVRGVANKELTGEIAYKVGRAGAYYLSKNYSDGKKPLILIGKDTRISGDMLEAALIAGITSVGVNVIKLGIIPTPGVAYLTEQTEANGGIMISASHNPIADNGIKFFDENGFKLTDIMEDDIEELIFNKYNKIPSPTHEDLGRVKDGEGLLNKYIDHLVATVNEDLSDLNVVLDCANGAAYYTAPQVLNRLGVNINVLNNNPAGEKINVRCGSTYPDVVREEVLKTGADIGIAHDGDADRIVMVDEKGEILDGDYIMTILALDLLQKGKLQGNTLVTTRYSNYGLQEVLNQNGAHMKVTKNGDRYVMKKMLEKGYNLGGEKSGHIILLDYNKTGDGILTAIQILQVIKESGKLLSELAAVLKPWPQRLENVRVIDKDNLHNNEVIQQELKRAEDDFGSQGRVFVRASGTEPVVRIMLEAKDESKIDYWGDRLVEVIAEELN